MGEITQWLDQARSGDSAARERFFSAIYSELDRLARHRLGRGAAFTMLDAPGLVNELYLRLADQPQLPGDDRRSFLAYASRVMRSVIIDYVRSRRALRHGGDLPHVTLDTGVAGMVLDEPRLLALGEAMDTLERIDERAHQVVEMRFFGGLELTEIAGHLAISPATVKRDWQKARAFLMHAMQSQAEFP